MLKGFARQLRIEGVEGYSPKEFLEEVRPGVLRIMRVNHQMTIKMILSYKIVSYSLLC